MRNESHCTAQTSTCVCVCVLLFGVRSFAILIFPVVFIVVVVFSFISNFLLDSKANLKKEPFEMLFLEVSVLPCTVHRAPSIHVKLVAQ